MGDERLQKLARAYVQKEIPLETYRAQRAELLDSLTAGAAMQPPGQTSDPAEEPVPPWQNWLPVTVASLTLASTLFWILA